MRYFWRLFFLRMKAALRSALFWITAVLFLMLPVLLNYLLPQNGQNGMQIGILAQGNIGEQTAVLLEQNEDYQMVRYGIDQEEKMRRDVLVGNLHCAYVLRSGSVQGTQPPILCYRTNASYMSPLLEQIVGSAYFESTMPLMAEEFLRESGEDTAGLEKALERAKKEAKPLEVEIVTLGNGPGLDALAQNNMQPLCYAILVCAFLGISILAAILGGDGEVKAQQCLAVLSHKQLATAAAPVLARVVLNLAVLLGADLLLNLGEGKTLYRLSARLLMLVALAVGTALCSMAVLRLRRYSTCILVLLPPFLLVGILCSGTLINPSLLPAGLGVLRFVSPAWYALQIVSI